MDIKTQVIEAVAELVNKDVSEINEDTRFADLGIDSLDITELAMNLEEAFDIELSVDASIATIGDLVEKITEAKK